LAGYSLGAVLTTFLISAMIEASGHQLTFFVFGSIFAAVGSALAFMLRVPPDGEPASRTNSGPGMRDFTAGKMLKTPVFWLMFAMYLIISITGFAVASTYVMFAMTVGINSSTTVAIFGTTAVIPAALGFGRTASGLARPFLGWISDRMGRENTIGLALMLQGCGIWLLLQYGSQPIMFVMAAGLISFGWGAMSSLFPAMLVDTFGTRYASTNYGFLHVAQGVGSVLAVSAVAGIHEATQSYQPVLGIAAGSAILIAALALFVLKPMRRQYTSGMI
jgi:MFS family permease